MINIVLSVVNWTMNTDLPERVKSDDDGKLYLTFFKFDDFL